MSDITPKPVRVQRSRKRGFRLQDQPNGLPVVYVGRPTKWENPYKGTHALLNYHVWVEKKIKTGALDLAELRGKNLACWCKPYEPCHADILLRLANQ